MTFLDETELRKVYRAKVKLVSTLPDEQFLSWENRRFRPPEAESDQIWVVETLTVLSEQKSTVGCIEATGTYQVLVYTPEGSGTEEADALSKAIAEALESGQSLTSSAITVILERTERAPFRVNLNYPGWVFKTVTSLWRVFTESST